MSALPVCQTGQLQTLSCQCSPPLWSIWTLVQTWGQPYTVLGGLCAPWSLEPTPIEQVEGRLHTLLTGSETAPPALASGEGRLPVSVTREVHRQQQLATSN